MVLTLLVAISDLDLCDWLYDKVKTIHEEGNTTEGVVAGGFDPEQKKSNEVLTDIQEVNPQNKCWLLKRN